ncbi:hypothetical protein AALP_AA8G465500 [Arabis alpina]|uniref:FBD domain-containing protein n=1 Tax=Arabis alpina TaxID=50452 RepID=A0A087GDV1_ARAAL|nr:hypothetical protein AALP_AA8G465500 [Arabis alpina]
MPKLREAYLDVSFHGVSSLIESITSVKHLTLSSKVHVYGGGLVFNQLEHLKLCVGAHYASNLLVRLLEDSPNLRVLDLFKMDSRNGRMGCWNQPSTVPECIMSSLETFKWSGYLGTRQERDLAVYILRNACRLKTATISFDDRIVGTKPEMIKELSLSSSTASTTCQLVFDQGF